MISPFTIHIPEEGVPRLLRFLDTEFPHCAECGGRMMKREFMTGPPTSPVIAVARVCVDCEAANP
jgi:hypothetical protein